jgi:uncharacterized membrane protein YtjA (UPF0391 family)
MQFAHLCPARKRSHQLAWQCRPGDLNTALSARDTTCVEGYSMLRLAILFLVIALIASLFGFFGVAGVAADAARILFFVFIVLAVLAFLGGALRTPPV